MAPKRNTETHKNSPLPKLVAFDLDATLWIPEMYELAGPPFRPAPGKSRQGKCVEVVDRSGEHICLMGDSFEILKELAQSAQWQDTEIAYVSRTEYPAWADACLKSFAIECGPRMHDIAAHHEIYPGSKLTHFRRLHERTGINYKDMLFFDNESWNIKEVAQLGVTCVHTPRGMTWASWQEGLDRHSKQKGPER
ncbi:acid phosphatase [Helicosporidium sp. ATCC 50920]|nr:acid phosphatase [Helicosporidium sp. ATCC 50920]|eukprot:KDD76075.1 acid phosphatase [Helicosporidium sp. ATCC 50920]